MEELQPTVQEMLEIGLPKIRCVEGMSVWAPEAPRVGCLEELLTWLNKYSDQLCRRPDGEPRIHPCRVCGSNLSFFGYGSD